MGLRENHTACSQFDTTVRTPPSASTFGRRPSIATDIATGAFQAIANPQTLLPAPEHTRHSATSGSQISHRPFLSERIASITRRLPPTQISSSLAPDINCRAGVRPPHRIPPHSTRCDSVRLPLCVRHLPLDLVEAKVRCRTGARVATNPRPWSTGPTT